MADTSQTTPMGATEAAWEAYERWLEAQPEEVRELPPLERVKVYAEAFNAALDREYRPNG